MPDLDLPDLDLFSRTADLVAAYPWAVALVALVLGLVAPARLRRIVQRTVVGILVAGKWTVIVGFGLAVVVYLLPLGVVCLAFQIGGLLPGKERHGDTGQLTLPFDR